ncbi:hypothetical protein BGZ49_005712 [Haplosporangium sp. Z 27]|nr:hypothetical protein BGZ49_005712 [Haplosporangium sp. Z 27]
MQQPTTSNEQAVVQDQENEELSTATGLIDRHQGSNFMKQLPQEIYSLIANQLSKSQLNSCVRVSKEWSGYFMPSLWEKIEIYGTDSYFRFIASIEGGGLTRNAEHIKIFSTQYFNFVSHLQAYEFPKLIELRVYSENDPPKPSPPSTSEDTARQHILRPRFGPPLRGSPLRRSKLDLTILVKFLQKELKLQTLFLIGRMFDDQPLESVSRLFKVIPTTVESLHISGLQLPFVEPPLNAPGTNEHEADAEIVPLNIKQITFPVTLLTEAEMILLFKSCPLLENLCITSPRQEISQKLCLVLGEHCPRLRDLCLQGVSKTLTDADLAELLNTSKQGWRTLLISCMVDFGPLSAEALLRHAPTLEELRVSSCSGLASSTIQRLLSTAPNLRRLEALEEQSSEGPTLELDAKDIIQSQWICSKLEVLRIKIAGIPRPDIRFQTNKRPLTGPLHEGEMNYSLQNEVYSQLGKMTNLKELILGSVDRNGGPNVFVRAEAMREGEYYDPNQPQEFRQYECLSFTLESGLERLGDLKLLERLHLQGMAVGFGGAAEQEWAKNNWPSLKYAYGDWNSG